jgi:hypothetical protein
MELVDAACELLGGWEPGMGGWEPETTLHCRTTCTRGSPFGPLIGVNVIVHVSVTGPESLYNTNISIERAHPRELERRTYQSSALSE